MITFPKNRAFLAAARGAVKAFGVMVVLAGCLASPAKAVVEPVPVASDPRVKTIAYAPDVVFKYTGYLRYQTSIEFAPDESIDMITMGDPTGWKFNPMGNKLFLKPTDLDVTTNMTLMTNKRTYLFELHAEEAKDISDKNLSFIVRFVYPDESINSVVTSVGGMDRVPNLQEDDMSQYNFRYTVSGSEDITPIRIFDDGEFTFMQFKEINADIPAIFRVMDDGSEEIINYRMRGPYVVVERVSSRYTLRLGKSVVCVFNEGWGKSGTATGSFSGMTTSKGANAPNMRNAVLK